MRNKTKSVHPNTAERILAGERLSDEKAFANSGFEARRVLANAVLLSSRAAQIIEDTLLEGFENCGRDPDCIYAEPLTLLRAARGK